MNVRRPIIGLIAAAGVVGWCDVAAATERFVSWFRWSSVTDTLALGIWSTITLLTAFIERPFYRSAGVERGALCRSIQINVLSSIVFGLFIIVSFDFLAGFSLASLILLIFLITGFEYLLLVEAERRPISFAQLWFGNAASLFAVIAILFAAISPLGYFVERSIVPYEDHLAMAGIALTVAWTVGACVAPLVSRRRPENRSQKSSAIRSSDDDPAEDDVA